MEKEKTKDFTKTEKQSKKQFKCIEKGWTSYENN